MHSTILLLLTGIVGLTTASPLQSRAVAKFSPGMPWDIILNSHKVDLTALKNSPIGIIDVDLFDLTKDGATTIQELVKTKQVIWYTSFLEPSMKHGYFSAGSREGWRDDAGEFGSNDHGKALGREWPNENWVNVKSDKVRGIMKKRIELAARAGCTAVDPDNVDGYDGNQDGYGYSRSAYADYVKYLASVAHENNLAIGLKNSLDMIPDVLSHIQFAVNEECHELGECHRYEAVTRAGMAVFNIEYAAKVCSNPANTILSTVFKPIELDTLGGQC